MVLYQLSKELKPGRILIVTQDRHYNKLGLLLSVHGTKDTSYKVLVLDDQSFSTASSTSAKVKVLCHSVILTRSVPLYWFP